MTKHTYSKKACAECGDLDGCHKKPMMYVELADGKYTVIQTDEGRLIAFRHGEPWRDCVGDNLIFQLAVEVERLRAGIQKALGIVDKACKRYDS